MGSWKMMTVDRICTAVAIVCIVSFVRSDENEYRLIRDLLRGYDKRVRPSLNYTESLNVTFGVALAQIIEVDMKNQILTTNCWLNQIWTDVGLQWDPEKYGDIEVIRLPYDEVWRPDILLYNNADVSSHFSSISSNVIVTSDGNVTWLCMVIFKSSCPINVRYFPFDWQNCSMWFASWTYDGYQINLRINSREGDLSNYVANSEWELAAMLVVRNERFYSCCKEPYPDVTCYIVIKRRPLFYIFNMVVPCILITLVALLGFYIPSDSGEKVTMGITTLLSMTVFMMLVTENMPPTSDVLPLIGIYYGMTIFIVSFATGMTVFTLNIHHKGVRGREVPAIIKLICFRFLARLFCIRVDTSTSCSATAASASALEGDDVVFIPECNGGLGASRYTRYKLAPQWPPSEVCPEMELKTEIEQVNMTRVDVRVKDKKDDDNNDDHYDHPHHHHYHHHHNPTTAACPSHRSSSSSPPSSPLSTTHHHHQQHPLHPPSPRLTGSSSSISRRSSSFVPRPAPLQKQQHVLPESPPTLPTRTCIHTSLPPPPQAPSSSHPLYENTPGVSDEKQQQQHQEQQEQHQQKQQEQEQHLEMQFSPRDPQENSRPSELNGGGDQERLETRFSRLLQSRRRGRDQHQHHHQQHYHHQQQQQLQQQNFDVQLSRVLQKIYQTIDRNEMRVLEQDKRDVIKLEWQQVALIADRVLLLCFVTATVTITGVVLFQSPSDYA